MRSYQEGGGENVGEKAAAAAEAQEVPESGTVPLPSLSSPQLALRFTGSLFFFHRVGLFSSIFFFCIFYPPLRVSSQCIVGGRR